MRSNGRAVLMSMDAGATWTDVTGDVGGESMHPDQHALAFVPGQPGPVLRRLRRRRHPHERQVGRRVEPVRHAAGSRPAFLADCHAWLSRIPTELKVMNAGLGDAADEQHLGQPVLAGEHGDDGHAGQRHARPSPGQPPWILPLTGDGGDSGFDATDPHLRFHTYTGGQMDVNYNDVDPTSWLWIGDRFIVNFPEAQRFYAPVDLRPGRHEDDLRRRPARVADAERRR